MDYEILVCLIAFMTLAFLWTNLPDPALAVNVPHL